MGETEGAVSAKAWKQDCAWLVQRPSRRPVQLEQSRVGVGGGAARVGGGGGGESGRRWWQTGLDLEKTLWAMERT